MAEQRKLVVGIIEGFYGQPWSREDRLHLFGSMQKWGLNTYMYAPKDDLKHRLIWRELYSPVEVEALGELIHACHKTGARFIYGVGPGLDIAYASASDRSILKARFAQLTALGCSQFALLFDDIPDRMSAEDSARFPSFASAQTEVANDLFRWLAPQMPNAKLFFCPTPYCGRMAAREFGGKGYLETLGQELLPEIEVFWTGPEIVSESITIEHLRELRAVLRRKPVLWDNLHANDYDGRRFFCGPYAGRDPAIREEINGILSNPNNEYPLNFVPLRTLGRFRAADSWAEAREYEGAMAEWLADFKVVQGEISLDHLRAFMDCFYLPFEDGPEATRLLDLLRTNPAEARQRISLLKDFCALVTGLNDRHLFYALSRRVWDLREELDLLERYLVWKHNGSSNPFQSDFHLHGTFRGGFIAKLQTLLQQQPDGSFEPCL